MAPQVCYERMRPRDVVAARQACPVAYLPLGVIEWHGPHNPLGCDGLLSHALAVRCAQAGGGLVFPPLWYGESREEGIMEVGAADRADIVAAMELPADAFAPGYMRASPHQQYMQYQQFLLHCLYQLRSLGFRVIVLVPGHYPLIDHARAACSVFHQTRFNGKRAQAITWAFTGHELVRDEFPQPGDHAGYWETSLMLALLPDLVELSNLPTDRPPVGVISVEPVSAASAEFGRKAADRIVQRVVCEVSDRLARPEAYYDHGVRL